MLYIVEQLFNILSVLLLSFIFCVRSDLSSSPEIHVEVEYYHDYFRMIEVVITSTNKTVESCNITLKDSTSVSMTSSSPRHFSTHINGNMCHWNGATVRCSMNDTSEILKNISLDNDIKPKIVMDKTLMSLSETRNVTATFYNLNLNSTTMNCFVRTSSYNKITKTQLQNLTEKVVIDQRCGYFNITKVFAFQAEKKWLRGKIHCIDERDGQYILRPSNINFESDLEVPLIIWKARSTLSVSNNRTVEGQFVIVTVTSEDVSPRAEHSCILRGSDGDETLTARRTPGDKRSTEFWFTAHRFYSEIICVIKQGNFSQLTETLKQTLSVKVLSAENKQSQITGLVISNIIYGVILVFVFVLLGIGFYKKILVLQLSKENKVEIKEDKITLLTLTESETD